MFSVARGARLVLFATGLVVTLLLALSTTAGDRVVVSANSQNPTENPQPMRVGAAADVTIALRYDRPQSWRQRIHHADAPFIKVHIAALDLAPGDTLTVSDAAGRQAHVYPGAGATTDDGPGFYALAIHGETVELTLAVGSTAADRRRHAGVTVDRYVYGLPSAELAGANGGAIQSTCGAVDRTDASCFAASHPTEYANSEAVAYLLTDNGYSYCTAWRVTSGNFFMTNYHCIGSQYDANAAELWFDYERPTCGGWTNTPIVADVGTYLTGDYTYDFALVTVADSDFPAIAPFGYFDLDPRPAVLGEPIYIPQHGYGNPREFGIFSDVNTPQNCQVDHVSADGYWYDTDIGYKCDTTFGSSGSPVVSSNTHGVIAMHHFGTDAAPYCAVTSSGSSLNRGVRMELIYPLIAPYFDGDFTLHVNPAQVDVCAGDTAVTTVNLGVDGAFNETVTLSADGGGWFNPGSLVPPGSSTYSFNTSGQPIGELTINITGASSSATHADTFVININDAAPGAPAVTQPPAGATDVPLMPTVQWTPIDGASYDVGIARNAAFTDLHDFALGLNGTSWSPDAALDPATTYYVAVRARNGCGSADSAVTTFTTGQGDGSATVLLVDDDDNTPDVRNIFADALSANGIAYAVWNTANSDYEPSAAYMSQFDMVVWFTGDEYDGFAGPSAASEVALSSYLDDHNGCLFISSQDYLWDRGGFGDDVPTWFMENYLGVAAGVSDIYQWSVTGQHPYFAGTYSLSYPIENWSDVITPDASAELLFLGNVGDAAIYKEGPGWMTSFWGFSFTGLPAAQRHDFMGKLYAGCQMYTQFGVSAFGGD